MKKYEKLTNYLQQFDSTNNFGKWIIDANHSPSPSYKIFIHDFIHTFYDGNYWIKDYLDFIEPIFEKLEKNINISALKENELLVLLTYIIRQERFCDGLLLGKCKDGTIYAILQALKKYDDTRDHTST